MKNKHSHIKLFPTKDQEPHPPSLLHVVSLQDEFASESREYTFILVVFQSTESASCTCRDLYQSNLLFSKPGFTRCPPLQSTLHKTDLSFLSHTHTYVLTYSKYTVSHTRTKWLIECEVKERVGGKEKVAKARKCINITTNTHTRW